MKKTFIMILVVTLSLLTGCQNGIFSPKTEDQEAIKARVQEKIVFYQTKLIELSGLDEAQMEEELSYIHVSSATASSGNDLIDREDLPQKEHSVFEGNGIDPEMIINMNAILDEFLAVLDICENYVADSFVVVENELFQYTIKTTLNGDYLFIESYRTDLELKGENVSTNIMEFDLIEGKIMFRHLMDIKDSRHDVYYDEFSEAGNILHASIDVKNQTFGEFQLYDRDQNLMLQIGRSNTEGFYMNYGPTEGSINYSIHLSDEGEITRYSIRYGQPTSFWYIQDDSEIHLYWNLFLVQGWNKCRLNSISDDQIFQDDIEKLLDFSIMISIEDKFANARRSIAESQFKSSMMDLSDFGMFFDAVTYETLQSDIDFIDQNHQAILTQYHLSMDLTANYDYVVGMLPFRVDEDFIEGLLNESNQ